MQLKVSVIVFLSSYNDYNRNIGTQSVQELFFVIGAFVELFTVMIFLSFLVAMYSKKETGNL